MLSWELVNKLLWMPFDIMQRLSRPFLYVGRAVYGGLFGVRQPAIKPPPPETTSLLPSSKQKSPSPLPEVHANLPVCTSPKNPSFCVVNMAENETTASTVTSNTLDSLEYLSENVTMPRSITLCQNSLNDKRCVTGTNPRNDSSTSSTNDSKKRLNSREKRRKANQKLTKQDNGSVTAEQLDSSDVPPELKKPRLSEGEQSALPAVTSQNTDSISKSALKNKKKRAKKKNKQGEDVEEKGEKMARSLHPNHFVAVQITHPDIISKVGELQNSLSNKKLFPPWGDHNLTSTEVFKDAMVPLTKLHFTLYVMHLNGLEDIEKAQKCFRECCEGINQSFVENPLDLPIGGVGHFGNSVLFASIKDKTAVVRLTELSNLFRRKFKEVNLLGDPRPFKPHLTIGKISRSNKLRKMKIRAFPPDIWSDCAPEVFGTQRVLSVQLLAMAGEDKLTGYYNCLHQHHFFDHVQASLTPVAPISKVAVDPDAAKGSQKSDG